MSSFFHSHIDHPTSHKHSSPDHQHGPLHDTHSHSPHRHNHPASPMYHPSLHSQETQFGAPEPTTHAKMTTPNTTNSAGLNNASNLQSTAPQEQGKSKDQGFTGTTGTTASYASTDPTTSSSAPSTSKVMGDLKGMAQGVVGSVQAAVGTTFGQKGMAEKGFEKMSEEDARLAAKSGKPAVGTETRSTAVDAGSVDGAQHGRGLPTDRTI